jgi:hypothetical protein
VAVLEAVLDDLAVSLDEFAVGIPLIVVAQLNCVSQLHQR